MKAKKLIELLNLDPEADIMFCQPDDEIFLITGIQRPHPDCVLLRGIKTKALPQPPQPPADRVIKEEHNPSPLLKMPCPEQNYDMTYDHQLANLDTKMKRSLCIILDEYNRACAKHPNWPVDHVHQAAIVSEESGELIRAALQYKYEKGRLQELRKESVQTATTALRLFLNL